jgi:hypothetical protein
MMTTTSSNDNTEDTTTTQKKTPTTTSTSDQDDHHPQLQPQPPLRTHRGSIHALTLNDLNRHNRVVKERLDDSTDAMNGSEDMEFMVDDIMDEDDDDDTHHRAAADSNTNNHPVRLSHLSLIAQDHATHLTNGILSARDNNNNNNNNNNDAIHLASLLDDGSCNGTYAKSIDDESMDASTNIRTSFRLSRGDSSTRVLPDDEASDYQC